MEAIHFTSEDICPTGDVLYVVRYRVLDQGRKLHRSPAQMEDRTRVKTQWTDCLNLESETALRAAQTEPDDEPPELGAVIDDTADELAALDLDADAAADFAEEDFSQKAGLGEHSMRIDFDTFRRASPVAEKMKNFKEGHTPRSSTHPATFTRDIDSPLQLRALSDMFRLIHQQRIPNFLTEMRDRDRQSENPKFRGPDTDRALYLAIELNSYDIECLNPYMKNILFEAFHQTNLEVTVKNAFDFVEIAYIIEDPPTFRIWTREVLLLNCLNGGNFLKDKLTSEQPTAFMDRKILDRLMETWTNGAKAATTDLVESSFLDKPHDWAEREELRRTLARYGHHFKTHSWDPRQFNDDQNLFQDLNPNLKLAIFSLNRMPEFCVRRAIISIDRYILRGAARNIDKICSGFCIFCEKYSPSKAHDCIETNHCYVCSSYAGSCTCEIREGMMPLPILNEPCYH